MFENLALKHKIVDQMEAVCKDTCIIATNTSSLPVADIAANAARPENIVGECLFSITRSSSRACLSSFAACLSSFARLLPLPVSTTTLIKLAKP